jgi:trimethylamine--corrinoid protein Co-methyltransferase
MPALMNRRNHAEWKGTGKKRLDERARETLSKRLAAYEKPFMDPEVERALSEYVARRKEMVRD